MTTTTTVPEAVLVCVDDLVHLVMMTRYADRTFGGCTWVSIDRDALAHLADLAADRQLKNHYEEWAMSNAYQALGEYDVRCELGRIAWQHPNTRAADWQRYEPTFRARAETNPRLLAILDEWDGILPPDGAT